VRAGFNTPVKRSTHAKATPHSDATPTTKDDPDFIAGGGPEAGFSRMCFLFLFLFQVSSSEGIDLSIHKIPYF
jgi:hypothetical protein